MIDDWHENLFDSFGERKPRWTRKTLSYGTPCEGFMLAIVILGNQTFVIELGQSLCRGLAPSHIRLNVINPVHPQVYNLNIIQKPQLVLRISRSRITNTGSSRELSSTQFLQAASVCNEIFLSSVAYFYRLLALRSTPLQAEILIKPGQKYCNT